MADVADLNSTIEKTKRCNKEYEGINVAIAGEPNVGKSTLSECSDRRR
jgi:tRNA U34 5-carboxymethylaminomethyl modifying GTPase MnmE/TrmE